MQQAITAQPRDFKFYLKLLGKTLIFMLITLLIAALVAHFVWKYSGDGEWKPVGEKNGVKMYLKKIPGQSMQIYRGTIELQATQSAVTKLMQDPKACFEEMGCFNSAMLEWVSEQKQFYTATFKMPPIFKPRQLVFEVTSELHDNGSLIFKVQATPDKIPHDECCFRVQVMNNRWEFQPLADGKLLIIYDIDMDEGGMMPYFLLNKVRPMFIYKVLPMFGDLLKNDKYQNAQFDFLQATKSESQSE